MALPLGEWGMESREGIKPSRAVLQTALLSENRLVERTAGIEPASSVWKTVVLPLNDVRMLVVPQTGVEPALHAQRAHLGNALPCIALARRCPVHPQP